MAVFGQADLVQLREIFDFYCNIGHKSLAKSIAHGAKGQQLSAEGKAHGAKHMGSESALCSLPFALCLGLAPFR